MVDIVADPGLDPRATYAVDPARSRRHTARAVATPGGEIVTMTSPLDGAPLAALPVASVAEVEVAFAAARAAQRAWAATPVRERAAVLLRFHDLVLDRKSELLDLIQLESGKVRAHAFEEVADCAIVARHYGRSGPAYLKDQRHLGVIPLLTQPVESHRPKGVVGIISPWNYPLSMAMTDALPALLAGNAVVLRPDLQSSLTALAGVALLDEAGLPDGVLQVVLGHGTPTGQAVVDRADYLCFTGSTATGRRIAASVAGRLTGFSLELGGKNAMYITADAPLDRAVDGAVRGCFASAGQLCISAERLIVHEDIWDAFVPRFVEAVGAQRLGTALHYGFDMGSLVGPDQLARVDEHVEDARAKGARVLTGGRARPDIGPYVYEPTVLEGVTAAMACRDEETFGPVVALYKVGSDDEAVRLANDTEYGLNASIWTRDVRRGRALAARIQAGTVGLNDGYGATWGSAGAPMGGMKQSGMGRRHGREGILKYTETQNVAAQHLLPVAGLPGMSDERYAAVMTSGLRLLKRLRFR